MPTPSMRDSNLSITGALPAGATTTKPAAGLDVGPLTSQGSFAPSKEGEFILEAPALTTGQLPDATTITYDIIESANSDLSSSTVVRKSALIQTGAGGAGAAAGSVRYRPVTGAARYLGFQATGVATVAASAKSATLTYVS